MFVSKYIYEAYVKHIEPFLSIKSIEINQHQQQNLDFSSNEEEEEEEEQEEEEEKETEKQDDKIEKKLYRDIIESSDKKNIFEKVIKRTKSIPVVQYNELSSDLYVGLLFTKNNILNLDTLLTYNKRQNIFMHLLPCRYTKVKLCKALKYKLLTPHSNYVLTFEKKANRKKVSGSRQPVWKYDLLTAYFSVDVSYSIYKVKDIMNIRAGKVRKIKKIK